MPENYQTIYSLFLQKRKISTDSRRISPGSVFFALRGDNFNGNDFARKALEDGASLAVVDDPDLRNVPGCILVENALTTLQEMAKMHRKRFTIPVIAITGTNGKTTTKELISRVLSEKYRLISTSGNLNNHIGVPLTLLEINEETDLAVIEMGANHPGEIDFLCNIADPDFGIITNIGKAHLEGFGSYEGVKKTKTELYRYIGKKQGKIFVNTSDDVLVEAAKGITCLGYGKPPALVTALSSAAEPYAKVVVGLPNAEELIISSKLYGVYNTPNIQAAVCAGFYFNVPAGNIKTAIENYHPRNNRSQIIETGKNLLVMDAYNANPGSMEVALSAFAQTDLPGKMLILGDMLELGDSEDTEHKRILGIVAERGFDQVYLVGPVFSRINTYRNFTCFQDSELAKLWFLHHKPEKQSILVKGSRGIRLEKVAEVL